MRKSIITGALTGMILLPFRTETAAQTVVFDGEITWEWPVAGNDYGGYSFYWWHQTSNPNYGEMPTDDWLSPDDYFNGEFRMRFEVLEQPTDKPFIIQVGIWQDSYLGSDHLEQVCDRVDIAKGTVFDASIGTPNNWWSLQGPGNKLDFSRPEDFYRIGMVLWNPSPLCIPKDLSWGAEGCPEYKDDFFPMRARVTVTATPGSGGPVVNPPNYSVDYNLERTQEVVSSSDQWSRDNSTWTNGDNAYLSLTPGEDVYFRKREDWSKTQTLYVKERPDTPEFTIDYIKEQTSDTVSGDYRISTSSDMSGAIEGTGSRVELTPGTHIYFQKWWTWSTFRSGIQTLSVPGRPAAPSYTIDYLNERTHEAVPTTDEVGSTPDMGDAVQGTGSAVDIMPGDTMYFRTLATSSSFSSATGMMTVPDRPGTPSFGIDYINETTDAAVETVVEYSDQADFNGAMTGTGSPVRLIPGTDLYFRVAHSDTSFASDPFMLPVPGRPAMPAYTVDFINETTGEAVTATDEYSGNPEMTGATAGSGLVIDLVPGTDLYFRTRATASLFSSEIQTLDVPGRPAEPVFTIDFGAETTAEKISNDYIYSASGDMSDAVPGHGNKIPVSPGTELHIRKSAAAGAFASVIQSIILPERPAAPDMGIDFAGETTSGVVPASMEYSTYSHFVPSTTGSGQKVPVIPGGELYLRLAATMDNFTSEILMLDPPLRPVITSDEGAMTGNDPFMIAVIFFQGATHLTAAGISAVNGTVDGVQLISALETSTVYQATVSPLAGGTVSLQVTANAVDEGNFTSGLFNIQYGSETGTPEPGRMEQLTLYPNPTTGSIRVSSALLGQPGTVLGIYSLTGKLMVSDQPASNIVEMELDLGHLDCGVYILKLTSDTESITRKVVLQGH